MEESKEKDSSLERFDETLGKLLSVSKKKLDEALEAERRLAEEAEKIIKPASDEEPE